MKERDIFRVATRTVGVIMLGMGLAHAFGSLFTLIGWQSGKVYPWTDRASAALAYLLSGLLIIVVGDLLTRLTYGRDQISN